MMKVCEEVVGPVSIVGSSVSPPVAGTGIDSVLLVAGNPRRFRLEIRNVGTGSAFLNADDTPTLTGFKLLGMEASTSGHERTAGGSLSLVGPAASAEFYAITDPSGSGFADLSVLEFIEGEPS